MPHEELIAEVELEIERIEDLFNKYSPYLEKDRDTEPDFFELGSLAMFLHSFYNGLENIFTRIAKRYDSILPDGEHWHKELLTQMASNNTARDHPVLTEATAQDLMMYLGFRHFSRHAYSFDLDWESMGPLILSAKGTKDVTIKEITDFLEGL